MNSKRTRSFLFRSVVLAAGCAFLQGHGLLLRAADSGIAYALPSSVPESVRESLSLDPFYQKYIDAGEFAILSSDKVSDYALLEARYIIDSMLVGRDDLRQALVSLNFRCLIMAPDEFTTEMPEHSDLKPRDYWDRRARGLGPTRRRPAISGAEENLLQLSGDPYSTENILVHEFAHAIHEALRVADMEFDACLESAFENAKAGGLWKGKYAASNYYEYWAEAVQSYFGNNRENDREHNHINTREELKEYDPVLFALIDETFRGNPWQYVFPKERTDPLHLADYSFENEMRKFEWPERLKNAARSRAQKATGASIEHVEREIEGWRVMVDISLIEGFHEELGRNALPVLGSKLRDISVVVPEVRLEKLRTVTIYLDREYPGLERMQYHPSAKWLTEHNHDPAMAKCVHIPRAKELVTRHSAHQQPWAVMHELAHAYHDQFLDFDNERIRDAWETFGDELDPPEVLHISGKQRRHYALENPKEFFAEMTEAYFGTNDFYPFVRAELRRDYPDIYELLKDIWGPIPYP